MWRVMIFVLGLLCIIADAGAIEMQLSGPEKVEEKMDREIRIEVPSTVQRLDESLEFAIVLCNPGKESATFDSICFGFLGAPWEKYGEQSLASSKDVEPGEEVRLSYTASVPDLSVKERMLFDSARCQIWARAKLDLGKEPKPEVSAQSGFEIARPPWESLLTGGVLGVLLFTVVLGGVELWNAEAVRWSRVFAGFALDSIFTALIIILDVYIHIALVHAIVPYEIDGISGGLAVGVFFPFLATGFWAIMTHGK